MARPKNPRKRYWLAAKRIELGLTQEELAKELGMPQPTYAGYEAGRRTPDWETAKKIGAKLDIDPTRLLEKPAS